MHCHPDIVLGAFDRFREVDFELDVHHRVEEDVDVALDGVLVAGEEFHLLYGYRELFVEDAVGAQEGAERGGDVGALSAGDEILEVDFIDSKIQV